MTVGDSDAGRQHEVIRAMQQQACCHYDGERTLRRVQCVLSCSTAPALNVSHAAIMACSRQRAAQLLGMSMCIPYIVP